MATETSCDPLQESDITESSVVFFVCPDTSPSRPKSVDHESLLSMGSDEDGILCKQMCKQF